MTDSPPIAFIGGGNMARSLIGGLIARGYRPAAISVSEPQQDLREALATEFGVAVAADSATVVRPAQVVVLAVKPQVMKAVCASIAPVLASRRVLLVSIAAGVRMTQMAQWLGAGASIVRCMPNTPALIGEGATGLIASATVDAAQREQAERILGAVGTTVWIEREELMDAVTATSGSGPAYFFLLMEALEAAAVRQGLPSDTARALVLQTCLGAARMARHDAEGPAQLRQRVTSPGGTTQAAVEVLEEGGFRNLVERAIERATARGRELSQALED